MGRKGRLKKLTAGYATFRWLSGVQSKEKSWSIGVLAHRSGYEAWMAYLTKGLLEDPEFLRKYEALRDPWAKSKLVGQKISELSRRYRELDQQKKDELAKEAEIELQKGLELMIKDKKKLQELLALVDPQQD